MPLYLTREKKKLREVTCPLTPVWNLSFCAVFILPYIWCTFHLSFSVTIIGTFIAFSIHHLVLRFLPLLLIDPSDGSRICSGCYDTGRALCACRLLPVWVKRSHARGRRRAQRSGSPSVDEHRGNALRPRCSYNADSNTSHPSKKKKKSIH